MSLIKLSYAFCIIVATKKTKVGHITTENHAVWRLVDFDVLPFSKSELHLTTGQLKLLQKQRSMITDLLQVSVLLTIDCISLRWGRVGWKHKMCTDVIVCIK